MAPNAWYIVMNLNQVHERVVHERVGNDLSNHDGVCTEMRSVTKLNVQCTEVDVSGSKLFSLEHLVFARMCPGG